ncbi:uncharacterized protein LOC122282278 [Carya illinoinensis]|uniref:uncharacterized protein LOC122282278 n=1 Tax=Carya illinoinensis TaxID=32201 RepID=UPI001C726458|nr:uncharacterized protein LOC122282278 [Carya illinoinensis]
MDFFMAFHQARPHRDLPDLSMYVHNSILEEENDCLLQLPSIQEVKEAMFSIPVDSSPGPDGFGHVSIDRVGTLLKMMWWQQLGSSSVGLRCLDFIRLLILLSPILSKIISPEQGAFLPGRNIFDNVMLAQEMIQMINKKVRGGNMFIKVDMAKAYDSIDWDFLLHVMKAFGFSSREIILSPYLFILVEETLSRLLKHNFAIGKIVSFSHPRGTPLISHLLYADDIVVFSNGGRSSLKAIRDVFALYEDWSGQMLKTSYFDDLLTRVRGRLDGWQNRILTAGARLLLLKHVALSIPMHLLSVLSTPKTVVSSLNRLMSNFFWGSSNGKQKQKWVAWQKICSPTLEGGLGLRKLEEVQSSLFMKMAWNLLTQDSLWANSFKHKYCKGNHVTLVDNHKGSSLWKSIINMVPKVLSHAWWCIKDGQVSFWRDPWLKLGPLVVSCDISAQPSLKVRECQIQNGWDVDLLKELVGESKLEEILDGLGENKEGVDVLIWKPTLNGKFSSKSA